MTKDESLQPELEGDFAAGERTKPVKPEDVGESELHGDFAAGEREHPVTPYDVEPGDFATGQEEPHGKKEPGTFADTESTEKK